MFFESEDGHDGSVDVGGVSMDRSIDVFVLLAAIRRLLFDAVTLHLSVHTR